MRLTRDDERARRVCSLALDFMNATRAIPSSEIARRHYPDLSADSFRRAFSRDREVLASCGVLVSERREAGGEALWEADQGRSFARGAELTPAEAAALELVCRPLVDDPTFPLADDLRFALAKISRSFSETLSERPARRVTAPRSLETLRSCLARRCAARVRYVNARGEASERTLAPYGFFALRESLYLVAARFDGAALEGTERTYRIDRFLSAQAVEGTSFLVPEDFCIEDWRRLPFQMGPAMLTARFEVPSERETDVRRAAGAQGVFSPEGGVLVWTVDVSDLRAAASWAISMGIRPLGPGELVSAWERILAEVNAA